MEIEGKDLVNKHFEQTILEEKIELFYDFLKKNKEIINENILSLMGGITFLQFFLIVSFFKVFNVSTLLVTIFFLINFIGFSILKEFIDDKKKSKGFKLLKLSVMFFSINLSNILIHKLFYNAFINSSQTSNFMSIDGVSAFRNVGFLFTIVSLIIFIYVYKKEEHQEIYEKYYNEDIFELLNLINPFSEGAIRLCEDDITKQNVFLPYEDRFLHMLILGPTGSGKTSQMIIPMLEQDIMNKQGGITVIEPKADLADTVYAMAQHYGREALYFNPIYESCPKFNPLYGKEEDVIENMVTTFKMLSPDAPQFFQDMNEQLLRNSLMALKRLKGNKATLLDLSRLISNPGGEGRKIVLAFSRISAPNESIAKQNKDIADYFLGDYLQDRSKTYEHTSGIRTKVSKITSNKYLRTVLNPEDGKTDINFDKHLALGGIMAIATAQGKLGDLGAFLGYFIILNFQSAVFRRPGNEDTRKPHFLYIDEFQVYSNPGFANMLTQGRSYRVASHLATQNRKLISMGGGREGEDFLDLVSTNARNIVVFPGGNPDDADYYSKQFGEIVEEKVQKGVSKASFNPLYGFQKISYPNKSRRTSEELVARFTASDIIQKKFGQMTYSIIQDKTLQMPSVGNLNWIDYELKQKLDKMIAENKALMFFGYKPENFRNQATGELIESQISIINDRFGSLENMLIEHQREIDVYILGEEYAKGKFGESREIKKTNTNESRKNLNKEIKEENNNPEDIIMDIDIEGESSIENKKDENTEKDIEIQEGLDLDLDFEIEIEDDEYI